MENEKKHNGWTNYETWRVNLECVDPVHWGQREDVAEDIYSLGQAIKDDIELLLEDEAGQELAKNYALAFIEGVNWTEIAKNLAEDNPKLIKPCAHQFNVNGSNRDKRCVKCGTTVKDTETGV